MKNKSYFLVSHMGLVTLFLYAPIILLMIYSFNDSRLLTVWSHFSFRWYQELWDDTVLLQAAWVSLRIAFFTACGSILLGTFAGMILSRSDSFKGKTLFSLLISVPLVMPEVIMGLALLLLFVAMEQMIGFPAGRGILTIWIAHVTFTTAYVTLIITSRLKELDQTIHLAAIDLGATPVTLFLRITLPMIMPALVSGWLLAFTLSLDDLVIASFVTGPNATTLPMVIFSSVRLGISPKINALSTIFITVVTLIALLVSVIFLKREKKFKN